MADKPEGHTYFMSEARENPSIVQQRFKTLWFPMLAAFVSFCLLQIDGIERSFLGAPDREMLSTAFKLRDGVARGSGDPVLWLDIDYETLSSNAQGQGRASPLVTGNAMGPSPSVPRELLATSLAYARHPDATLVLLDVDIGWGTNDPKAETLLEAQLKAWASDPTAPFLVIAREVLPLPEGPTLMPTRYDDIVARAGNIAYAGVNTLSGGNGVREFVAGQCVGSGEDTTFMPSAVTFATAAQTILRKPYDSAVLPLNEQIQAWVAAKTARAAEACITRPGQRQQETAQHGLVSWHIGYAYPRTVKAARVSANWPHTDICQLSGPPATATRISVSDIMADPNGASKDPLCRRLVIIGADNLITQDRDATPIGMLPGPIILANAMRGHFDTGPIVRGNWNIARLSLQIILLLLTVGVIVWAFDWVAKQRVLMKRDLVHGSGRRALGKEIALFLTHPLCFKFVIAFATFGFGALVTALSLEVGFWGLLSAPAYLATLFEAWHQIDAERQNSLQLAAQKTLRGET